MSPHPSPPSSDCRSSAIRPDHIDSALLRPGRLDKSLLYLPGIEDRKNVSAPPIHHVVILTLSCSLVQIFVAVSMKLTLAPSVDFDELARITEGFSGANL